MIKNIVKAVEKLYIPIIMLNVAAIGSVFYNRGKLDAIAEIAAAAQTEEV